MSGITGGSNTGNKANVDSGFNLQVALPLTDALVGSVRTMSENDDGTITGAPLLRSPETSEDYRLRVGQDTVIFSDEFQALAQNTDKWAYTFVTLTAAQPGAGSVNFGTVQGTAGTHGAFMRTFQHFPMFNTAPLAVEFTGGMFTAPLVADEIWLSGLGLPTAAITRPVDGVWFKLTSAGLVGVTAYAGVEVETGVLLAIGSIPISEMRKYLIVIGERAVQWWVNDQLLGTSTIPAGQGAPFQGASAPVFMQKYCTGAVSNTNTMRVARVGVSVMDISFFKRQSEIACSQGKNATNGQNGQTMGNTAGNFANTSAIPTPAVALTNTTLVASAPTGLGGVGTTVALVSNVAAGGDLIASSFLNPAPTINITGRNLIISSVYIYACNTGAAVATTPTTLLWGIAYGHTALSLATTETASFATATTHSPRKVPLGMMSAPIGTPIGGLYAPGLIRQLDTPFVVRPGEYVQTTVRFLVGTATASQTVTYTIQYEGYWE